MAGRMTDALDDFGMGDPHVIVHDFAGGGR
jgi:hypothetical protein